MCVRARVCARRWQRAQGAGTPPACMATERSAHHSAASHRRALITPPICRRARAWGDRGGVEATPPSTPQESSITSPRSCAGQLLAKWPFCPPLPAWVGVSVCARAQERVCVSVCARVRARALRGKDLLLGLLNGACHSRHHDHAAVGKGPQDGQHQPPDQPWVHHLAQRNREEE